MNCKAAGRLFQEYVEGRLFGLERKDFEDHLAVCPICAAELEEHRALFGMLGQLEPEPAPVWFEETVIRKLRLEGLIHAPVVPLYRRMAIGFNKAPDRVKYPLAALLSALAIYLPIQLLVWFAEDLAGKAAVFISEGFVVLDETLKNISVLSKLFEILEADVKVIVTILKAIFSLLSAAGSIVLPVSGVSILISLLVIRHLKNPHRRSHNAPYSL
jgi:hypothetical protein